ncbi:vacuolating cytotoxin domain-containing protein [Escherichia coli]
MKRAGEAGKALRAGGGADFIFSASERVVMAGCKKAARRRRCSVVVSVQ